MIPRPKHDTTIVLVPFECYSGLNKAVDKVFASLGSPFKLIVLEGGAPDPIRLSLEKRQKKHSRRMKVIYTRRGLSSGSLMNLALPHVHTRSVLFLGSDVSVSPAVLHDFLKDALSEQADIVSASVRKNADLSVYMKPGVSMLNIEAAMFNVSVLNEMGGFDEHLPHFLLGLDLMEKARRCRKTIKNLNNLEFVIPPQNAPMTRCDLKLFFRQWNVAQFGKTVKMFESGLTQPVQIEALRTVYRQQRMWAKDSIHGGTRAARWGYKWPLSKTYFYGILSRLSLISH